ncbi:MAG: CvpA family protein [Phycisphaerales bacterium]|nr:CvpA family protein [Phycisphaerales bacterium]
MLINGLVILILLGFGYLGFTRGFYSMLLHFGAVIVAGAVALGLWEPLAYYLLRTNADTQWICDVAWGVSLAVPFALTLSVLLGIQAAVLRSNLTIPPVANYVGGGVLGIVSGVFVAGFTVMSLSFVRGHTAFTDFKPVDQQSNGSMTRGSGLWVPVDRLTAMAYQWMSINTLYESENLAKYYPDFAERPHLMGANPDNATLKLGVPEKAVEFLGRYTVGEVSPLKYDELVVDSLRPNRQTVMNLDGEDLKTLSQGQYSIQGFVVNFKPAAREKMGQVAVGPGSATLIMWNRDTDTTMAIQPFALISQAKPPQDKPDAAVRFARWRFDAKGTFLGSVGGATDSTPMAYEFLVPKQQGNFIPLALYVRGIRIDLIDPATDQPKPAKIAFKSTLERDTQILTGELVGTVGGAALDSQGATELKLDPANPSTAITATNQLPFQITLNKSDIKIPVDDKNRIQDGEQAFNPRDLSNRGIERDLRVDKFAVDNETAIVQIDVGKDSPLSLLLPTAAEATGAPVLVSAEGQRFSCIGYVYKDGSIARVRHTPSRPVDQKDGLPSLTMSRTDQSMRLIFRVSMNATIKQFAIGDKVIADINPPLTVNQAQR